MSKKALQWYEDADIKRKPTYWISEWQGHLLHCPGRLKWFQDTPQVDFTAYLGGVESLNLACFGLVMEVVLTNRHLRQNVKTAMKLSLSELPQLLARQRDLTDEIHTIFVITVINHQCHCYHFHHHHLWMEMFTLNVSWAKGTLLVQLGRVEGSQYRTQWPAVRMNLI